MFTLLASFLAALCGLTYWLLCGTWQIPYWLMAAAVIGSITAAQALEDFLRRRRFRAGRPRRTHARKDSP